jgi:hypothetical protein
LRGRASGAPGRDAWGVVFGRASAWMGEDCGAAGVASGGVWALVWGL